MPDLLGAEGNGSAWYAPVNADITNQPTYQTLMKYPFSVLDIAGLRTALGGCLPTPEGAALANYLKWCLDLAIAAQA